MNPSVITLVERQGLYYLADELKLRCPTFFAGTSKTIRKIVEKKKIPETEYVYATTFKKQWKLCDESCKKGKLLLTKNWSDLNIKLNEINSSSQEQSQLDELKKNKENKYTDEQIINAPGLLILEDNEKFRDSDGNIIEIETRGEKQKDKIFFKVKDVSIAFNLPNLNNVLLHSDKGYERNTDYITFNILFDNFDKCKKNIYLTFNGFCKMIVRTRRYIPVELSIWLHKLIGIPFTFHRFISAETDTINSISNSLNCHSIMQYSVDKYRIDLYIPDFKLAIECDEGNHKYKDIDYETERELYITKKLNCIFIRYDPYDKNFDIFNFIKNINKQISIIKEYDLETLKNNYEKEMLKVSTEMLKKDLEIQKLLNEKDNYKNMYNYSLKEQENKDIIYKLQIENLKLQIELGKK